jgi:siroheme synthase
VTAALAAAAYAAMPLTHRDLAHSCTFVTGHARAEGEEPDWESLARAGQTVVFYMPIGNMARICSRLIGAGAAPDLPAALVENASMASQRVLGGNLHNLPQRLAESDIGSPALLIVGPTVSMHERLGWFGPAQAGGEERFTESAPLPTPWA